MAIFKKLPFFDYQQRNKISLYLLLRKIFGQIFSHYYIDTEKKCFSIKYCISHFKHEKKNNTKYQSQV